MKSLKFKNKGITFAARIIEGGESYGRDDILIHEDESPLIEFFDLRYPHSRINENMSGQFISRYTMDVFNKVNTGIFLDSGSIDWSLTRDSVKLVQDWVQETLNAKQIVSRRLKP